MAKDDRLYARFDIGMDEHPKIMLLSDGAFRALIESTFYARRQRTDGFLVAAVARKKWGAKAATELTSNDADRPSWIAVDGGFQIHDFDKHQTTNADIEAKREAGRAGGRAKASNRVAGATDPPQQKRGTTLAKTDTETDTTTTDVVEGARKRATRIPEPFIVNREMRDWAAKEVPSVEVDVSTRKFVDHWRGKSGRDSTKLDWVATWRNWLRSDAERSSGKPSPTERATRTVRLATDLLEVES